MKQALLLVSLTLLQCADGLSIVAKGSPTKNNVLALQETAVHNVNGRDNNILVRPHAGLEPEQIKYALRAMNFYGSDLKHHSFSIDMVMSLRWADPRVIKLVPAGLEKVTMAWKQALKHVWMPGIVVSNRDIEKYEIISSSITIFKTGEVLRVERANCRVMKKFMLEEYPFDSQNLTIKIASSKYMLEDVQLVPDDKKSGVEESIWGLYDLQGWWVKSEQTHDGELQKSRGGLYIHVKRSLDKYSQDHLIPSGIVLMISWAVFYFPFAGPFITARLALSILALLTFTNLMVKSTKELPGAAPFNWNDLFNQQIQTLMFGTIVLNIVTEICFHQFHNQLLARVMNHEAKVLVPALSILNIVIILGSARNHWMTLDSATTFTKISLICLAAMYGCHVTYGAIKFAREEMAKAAEENKA